MLMSLTISYNPTSPSRKEYPVKEQMRKKKLMIFKIRVTLPPYLVHRLNEKTETLHADQEFLKEELKVRERETLEAYHTLMGKKKQLMQLVQNSFNKKTAFVDISLTEELDQLKKIINGQEIKIQHLRSEIGKKGKIALKLGLAGVLNDESSIKIKNKAEQIEKEIKVGRKFSSTQYVRDYLQRPQAYKVSYEQAKYEYELRVRIKECLQQQKQLY